MHFLVKMATTSPPEGWKKTTTGWKKAITGVNIPGIPAPSGKYRIGCVDLMHQLEGDERNGLLLRLHYPTQAKEEEGFTYAGCYPHTRYIQAYLEFQKVKVDSERLSKYAVPKMPALEGAPLLPASSQADGGLLVQPTLPVIVFSHGLGGMRTSYSATVCDLASRGYLVACIEHRDGSASVALQRVPKPGGDDGELQDQWLEHQFVKETEQEFPMRNEQVKVRVDDARKSLDILNMLNEGKEMRNMLGGTFSFKQFQGRLAIDMTAIMGHSYGGATTVLTLAEDKRFKCGIAMDCWMFPLDKDFYTDVSKFSSPLYFISSYHFQWKGNVRRMMTLVKPPDSEGKTSCRVLTLRGTHHFNQCDLPFVTVGTLKRMGMKESELDNVVAHKLNVDICLSFLQRYLLKDPAYQRIVPNLDGTEGHSEHIIFGTNLDLSSNL